MKKFFALVAIFYATQIFADEKNIPLSRVTLYSSGVAFFEHEGTYADSFNVPLHFSNSEMNDVLKSLIVFDENAKNISLVYNTETNEKKLLENIGMQNYETLFDFFNSHKGSEVEIVNDIKTVGKIISASKVDNESILALLSYNGIHSIPLKNIRSFRFTHANENAALEKLSNVLFETKNANANSVLHIVGNGERKFLYGYTIANPVWKATYRLNVKNGEANFQMFAIIDNQSAFDWKNISLTLTTGKPVGFVQNLFAPYYTVRKTLPLSIADAADPITLELAYEKPQSNLLRSSAKQKMAMADFEVLEDSEADINENEIQANTDANIFSFTIQNFSLEKGKSIMLPIVDENFPAKLFSVFQNMNSYQSTQAELCIRFTNKTNLQFPSGPATLFDSGEYLGDALTNFIPANATNILQYGRDNELYGTVSQKTTVAISNVKMNDGILFIEKKQNYNTSYKIKNVSIKNKNVIIEHKVYPNAKLLSNEFLLEQTATSDRFSFPIEKNSERNFTVSEEETLETTATLSSMTARDFISYSTNGEMNENVRKTFAHFAKMKSELEEAKNHVSELQTKRNSLESEQERARNNFTSLANEEKAKQQFLEKILSLEEELRLNKLDIENAENNYHTKQLQFAALLKNTKL